MQVWHGIEQIPADLTGSVVTIGNFDGVHRGHRAVLETTISHARARRLPAVALTFDPHPAQVHRPEAAPSLLTGLTDRLELLADAGIDVTLVVPYTLDFARATPEEFVRTYLLGALHAQAVVVGHDTRFGRDNSGDQHTMSALGREHGFDVEVVHDVGEDRRWSSSWARQLVESGDVAAAATVLGRPHRMRGVVVRGYARGRELGYPTANLAADSVGTIPADGVYAGWLRRHGGTGERLPAAISIGTNPTFGDPVRTVEAHVIGRDDLELYDEEVVVEFVTRLRPTLRFDGVEPLIAQMGHDVQDALAVLRASGV
ncbi:bifunctional riboflavin kinase/FAD synthetase [Georgenia sp. 311]|uniref:bifunctional riboflavin kinase/FAD synthetase n=1 Tax=Georgenia sp. 311 TaxID=2585134 RepID=UPI001111F5D8|nr:bifunctional riboflavin kinase/FAD synthetase [Georgenia sp. 311]TNC16721.1 bifunctional riboflavin kinase/FAD synthetase [Georgenia sp. 311]